MGSRPLRLRALGLGVRGGNTSARAKSLLASLVEVDKFPREIRVIR